MILFHVSTYSLLLKSIGLKDRTAVNPINQRDRTYTANTIQIQYNYTAN